MLISQARLGLGGFLRYFPSAVQATWNQGSVSDGFLGAYGSKRCFACATAEVEDDSGVQDEEEPKKEVKVKSKRQMSPEDVKDHRKLLLSLGLSMDVLEKLEGSIVLISVGDNKGETEVERWSRRIRAASGGRGLIPRTRLLARGKRRRS